MGGFLNYLIEANIGILTFLVCYQFLLRMETGYRFTRFFLLAGIFVSVIFPLIQAHSKGEASMFAIGTVLPSLSLSELAIDDALRGVENKSGHTTSLWIWIYGSISLVLGVRFAVNLRFLITKIRSSKTYRRGNFNICESTTDHPTFSFFNFIFIGASHRLTDDEREQIIHHEMAHANHYHSIDIIAVQILRIFFWFNPFMSAYKNAIVQTHEFEADATTTKALDSNRYCNLLAKISLQSNGFALANHFNHSLTLKRIAMIRSVKNKMSLWKMAICCLTIPAAFLFVSCQDQLGSTEDDKVFYAVDEHAYPKQGLDQFYNEIKKTIRYPKSSRSNYAYGRVLVQFVVNENGTLSDIEILKSPDEALAEEGRRILSLSSAWVPAKKSGQPVKEKVIIPINFMLHGETKTYSDETPVGEKHSSLSEIVVTAFVK